MQVFLFLPPDVLTCNTKPQDQTKLVCEECEKVVLMTNWALETLTCVTHSDGYITFFQAIHKAILLKSGHP